MLGYSRGEGRIVLSFQLFHLKMTAESVKTVLADRGVNSFPAQVFPWDGCASC